MEIKIFADDAAVAKAAAGLIADAARNAVAARGVFVMAVSGGKTPWQMLRELANEDVPWANVHVFQIDERIAPAGDPDRNLTHLRDSLLSHAPLPPDHIHAMAVESENLDQACADYASELRTICGGTGELDLAHLGLGPDGHTASLIPGDPVLKVTNQDVALTGVYQGRNRMTVTYPVLNRARQVMWLATGAGKIEMLPRLVDGDPSIPAGHVRQDAAILLTDKAAAAGLESH